MAALLGSRSRTGVRSRATRTTPAIWPKAYTPHQWETKQVRDALLEKLQEHGVRWADSYSKKTFQSKNFTSARLMELLHLVEGVAADNTMTDLDASAY
jgi:hypothetical protein